MIWFNIMIPVIAIIILLFFFMKKVVWWEYAILLIAPFIINPIVSAISAGSQTSDVEYLHSYISNATYTEYWETWVTKECSREVPDGTETYTDSKGNTQTRTKYRTEYYDCSECERHSPSWDMNIASGKNINIDDWKYNELKSQWKNESKRELDRSIDYENGCGVDGDEYNVSFTGEDEDIKPYTWDHNYKNVIKVNGGVFKYDTVTSEDFTKYGLYNYPSVDTYNYNPIIGYSDVIASKKLQAWNARFGEMKQVNILILVYKNQPIKAAQLQEAYWQGGNKNEFVLCIGIDDNKKIQWTHTFSWTEKELLKVEVKNTVLGMDFDLIKIIDYTTEQVRKKFVRKQFKDFDYIKVEPTTRATIIASILILLITIGLMVFVVRNEHNR